ncbi:MAG: helix-turn-helix domain-containing protein [Candidatus Omnitrophica bacterium]|nr:helix-turn-helix domain-containing protein [Candidatus Omnitrophota bacterium]
MYFENEDQYGKEGDRMDQQKANAPKRPERTQIMTPKEAAKYLGFHLVTVYRLLKKNEIPATKIGGQWRFKKDILDAWLQQRMNSR